MLLQKLNKNISHNDDSTGGIFMSTFKAFMFIFLLICCFNSYAQEDIKGSKDHPLIKRFPGSTIIFYEQKKNVEYQLPLGPLIKNPDKGELYIISEKENIGGKLTRIQYKVNNESAADVFKSYEDQIKDYGFEILISTQGQKPFDIGGRTWSLFVYKDLPDEFKNNLSRIDTVNLRRGYLSAKFKREEGEAYIILMANQSNNSEIYIQLDIIEIKPIKRKVVATDADSIKKALTTVGHIALYDIYFEEDKYEFKPGYEPALEEVAEFLKQNPNLDIYVVSHTDLSGRLDNNLMVSKNRATTIVNALIRQYAIGPDRLIAEGVGPLSPVASNLTKEGRARNMRIELVLR
jgi:outer membrane protein OmpA-like peptidoglycan-associated protein